MKDDCHLWQRQIQALAHGLKRPVRESCSDVLLQFCRGRDTAVLEHIRTAQNVNHEFSCRHRKSCQGVIYNMPTGIDDWELRLGPRRQRSRARRLRRRGIVASSSRSSVSASSSVR